MKLGFTFKDIKVGDKANIGEVNIQVQYNAGELQGEYALLRQAIKEIPDMVADLGAGALAFEKMDKAFDGLTTVRRTEFSNEEVQETEKQSAINKVMEVVNSLRGIVPSSDKIEEDQAV